MPFGQHSPLFMDLAFKPAGLRAFRREGLICSADPGSGNTQFCLVIKGHDHKK